MTRNNLKREHRREAVSSTPALIGYARVSTEEQSMALQIDALEKAGCTRIFIDQGVSAVAKSRPGFEAALLALAPGDTLVVWKMDRAFRSLRNALDVLEQLEVRGVEFRSLTDAIDTSTPIGRCMYQLRNAFAELERSLISERTKAGLAAARRRGVRIGRPPKLGEAERARLLALIDAGHSKAEAGRAMGLHPASVYRLLGGLKAGR